MIINRWDLSEAERGRLEITQEFLAGRLEERKAIDWALSTDRADRVRQLAVSSLISMRSPDDMPKLWREVWAVIQDSWADMIDDSITDFAQIRIAERIKSGETSRNLITEITELVRPRISVTRAVATVGRKYLPNVPTKIEHLVARAITSVDYFPPSELGIYHSEDPRFLSALASGLEQELLIGLDIGRTIGWNENEPTWRLGFLYKVYSLPSEADPRLNDPDAFHRGIAPVTKTLYEVVRLLSNVDIEKAKNICSTWSNTNSPVHRRLWAAIAKNTDVFSSEEIFKFLDGLTDDEFWDCYEYPEMAELRAGSYSSLSPEAQEVILERIEKLPPPKKWEGDSEAIIQKRRRYFGARELRRIEITDNQISNGVNQFYRDLLEEFPELREETEIDFDFLSSGTYTEKISDDPPRYRFDTLSGAERLNEIETLLMGDASGPDSYWMRAPGKTKLVLADLESVQRLPSRSTYFWREFFNFHTPNDYAEEERENACSIVLEILLRISDINFHAITDAVCSWLSVWRGYAFQHEAGTYVWLKVWPHAVSTINRSPSDVGEDELSAVFENDDDISQLDMQALNTSIGHLVNAFFSALQVYRENYGRADIFAEGTGPRQMRDQFDATSEHSKLIVLHRLIQFISYFDSADPEWTRRELIDPLLLDTKESRALWCSFAKRTHYGKVFHDLFEAMALRATDAQIGRKYRKKLAQNLIWAALHTRIGNHTEPLDESKIQQMLRTSDNEVMAQAALALRRFIVDNAVQKDGTYNGQPDAIFEHSVKGFIEDVWPKERRLITPEVSSQFSKIPSACEESFETAVEVVCPFLIPYRVQSLHDYNLYPDSELERIDTDEKASALLTLLDKTIGSGAETYAPYQLSKALSKIESISSKYKRDSRYQRLITLSRRGW